MEEPGAGTPYNLLYEDAPTKRGTFLSPRYEKGVPFSVWRHGKGVPFSICRYWERVIF